jgi:hypothetical protein
MKYSGSYGIFLLKSQKKREPLEPRDHEQGSASNFDHIFTIFPQL